MRSFIGIDFSTEVKNSILDIQNIIKKYAPKARWKYVDNFHLTLKFLDEIDDGTADLIDRELSKIIECQQSFKLRISEIGAFKGGRPVKETLKPIEGQEYLRVLWLSFSEDIDKLKELQKNIESSLQAIGIEKEERTYTPHLTIAQDVLLETNLNTLKKDINLNDIEGIIVDRMYLYKSEQIGKNRVYTKTREYIFNS